MTVLASELINWSALWRIVLASLIGGTGVVVIFGVLLLGVKYAHNAKNEGGRILGFGLAGVCGALCIAAVAIGIIAMADKPASKAKKAHKSAAVLTTRQHQDRLVA
jgi:hypothetical protein